MDKREGLILAGIMAGAGMVIALTMLLANGVIKNPFI